MSTQARASEWDQRLYNVNRDVAHNFGDVMREVAARLEDDRWETLSFMLERVGWKGELKQEALGQACEAYCLFVMTTADNPKESMGAALARVGWNDVPEPAQVALMAIMGTVLSGYFWAGAREASIQGVGPCLTYQDLRDAGRRAAKQLLIPRWKRVVNKLYARWLAVWDALRGKQGRTPLNADKIVQERLAEISKAQAQKPKREGIGADARRAAGSTESDGGDAPGVAPVVDHERPQGDGLAG